jgi:DNA modification methylase
VAIVDIDLKELKKTLNRIGPLNRVVKSKDGTIIDGLHRLAADPNWPTIQLDEIDTEDKKIIARLTLNWMSRELEPAEIEEAFTRLCQLHEEDWKGPYSQRIADITGWNIGTVEKYLPLEYKRRPQYKQRKGLSIPPLNLSKGKEYIKRLLPKYGLPTWLQPKRSMKVPMTPEHEREVVTYEYNVWEADLERPEGYGDASFPGNTSPNIAREVLLLYTKEGDLVLDNMAGSGTMLDMCKELNRRCISFDISPRRHDIEKGDARDLPLPDSSVDLIFSHFPHGDMHRYSRRRGDLSGMSQQQFLEESKKVMAEARRILKPNHYYAVLIGDQRKEKELIDWSAEFSIASKEFFKLHDKIIWYAKAHSTHRQSDKYDVTAEDNFCKQTFDTLLIFKK